MFMVQDKLKGKNGNSIGIFENQYKNKKPLTVVKPGTSIKKIYSYR